MLIAVFGLWDKDSINPVFFYFLVFLSHSLAVRGLVTFRGQIQYLNFFIVQVFLLLSFAVSKGTERIRVLIVVFLFADLSRYIQFCPIF